MSIFIFSILLCLLHWRIQKSGFQNFFQVWPVQSTVNIIFCKDFLNPHILTASSNARFFLYLFLSHFVFSKFKISVLYGSVLMKLKSLSSTIQQFVIMTFLHLLEFWIISFKSLDLILKFLISINSVDFCQPLSNSGMYWFILSWSWSKFL